MVYPKSLRILHTLLMLCILCQLLIGELMDVPGMHGGEGASLSRAATITPETAGFEVHEVLGLIIAGLLLIRLLLAFSSIPQANWRHLLPWLSGSGRKALATEITAQAPGWKKGRLAPPEEGETIAKMAHGLMLLTAIGIAAAGVILFFGWNAHGRQTDLIGLVGDVHTTLVDILIALLAVHVLAVILHQRQGHNILARMRPGG
jgi:cytochrome b561